MATTDYTFGGHANAIYDAEGRKSDQWPSVVAGNNPGVVPAPGYIWGTHARALYDAETQKTQFWGSFTPGSLARGMLVLDMSAAPQDWPFQPQPNFRRPILTQPVIAPLPLRSVVAGPQFADLTLQPQFQKTIQFGSPFVPPVTPINTSCGIIDIYDSYDETNGTILVAWGHFGAPADSYNVYLNGVFNQNVTIPMAVIGGLSFATYVNQVQTSSPRYVVNIVAVNAGVETATSEFHPINSAPTSVMLVTPMKRPFPFGNTGD